MTDAMDLQESSESQEVISEVSEVVKRVDDTTFEPEAVVEREMEIQEAEAIEAALGEVVITDSAEKASDQPVSPLEPSDSGDEISAIPITLPAAAREEEITIGAVKAETLKEAEQPIAEDRIVAEAAHDVSQKLDGPTGDSGDDGELVVAIRDSSDDGPELDMEGMKTTDDIRQPTSVSDKYAPGGVGDSVLSEGEGYMGSDPGEGLIPGEGDGGPLDGLMGDGETGIPGFGAAEDGVWSEGGAGDERWHYGDPGKDPKTQAGGPGGGVGPPGLVPGGDPSREISSLPGQDHMEGWAERPDLRGSAGVGGGDSRVSSDDKVVIKEADGQPEGKVKSSQGDDPGVSKNVASGRAKTQDPEGAIPNYTETPSGPAADHMDTPMDYAESMMQPGGDEDVVGDDRPPPIEFDRDSRVDPYAQYTEDHVDVPQGSTGGEVDPDSNLIDPPDIADGVEGGFMESDDGKKRQGDIP